MILLKILILIFLKIRHLLDGIHVEFEIETIQKGIKIYIFLKKINL